MGFLAAMSAERRSSSQHLGHPRDPVVASWFGGSNNTGSGMSVTADSAMKTTAVFRAVMLKSSMYASLPLEVYREDGNGSKTPDPTHPNYNLLRYRPNRWQTSYEWREMMAAHFELRGACYSEIVSSGGRGVAELVPLHPDRVRAFRAPNGEIAFDYAPLNGPSRIILQGEMHYMHLFAKDDGFQITPLSPIGVCREAVGLAMATEEHGARLFSNGTTLGGLLKMKGHLKDDDARKRFMKSWKEAYAGVRNAGKTALLEDDMDYTSLGMTSEDAQYIETRVHQLAEIARITGVPPHKLYDLARSTNNNIEHQGIEFVTDTIRPGAVRWEQAMKRDLFYGADTATHCAEFDLDGLMRGDQAAMAVWRASVLQNGTNNRNEVRGVEGWNRSAAPGMDDFTVQSNMIPIGLLEQNMLKSQQQKQVMP